jgi:hypothetical protein
MYPTPANKTPDNSTYTYNLLSLVVLAGIVIVGQICRDGGSGRCTRSILVTGEWKRNIRGNGLLWEFRGPGHC